MLYVSAVLVNKTIDDTVEGLVKYLPDTGVRAWNLGGCPQCAAIGLDEDQLFDKTYHDGTVRF